MSSTETWTSVCLFVNVREEEEDEEDEDGGGGCQDSNHFVGKEGGKK